MRSGLRGILISLAMSCQGEVASNWKWVVCLLAVWGYGFTVEIIYACTLDICILLHTFCNGPKQNREMASPLPMKCGSVVGRLMAWSPLCQVCQHLQMIVLQDLGRNPNGLRLCCWCSHASQDHGLLVGWSISIHFCASKVQLRSGAASAANCHDVGWHIIGWHAAHGTYETIATWTLQKSRSVETRHELQWEEVRVPSKIWLGDVTLLCLQWQIL